MDPDKTLEALRAIAERLNAEVHHDDAYCDDAFNMADLFQALDHWLTCGGFMPKEWQR